MGKNIVERLFYKAASHLENLAGAVIFAEAILQKCPFAVDRQRRAKGTKECEVSLIDLEAIGKSGSKMFAKGMSIYSLLSAGGLQILG